MTTSAQQTVYTKTAKGILEIRNKSARLSRELAVVFQSVDGKATVTELLPKSGMTAPQLHQALNTLVSDGYIRTVAAPAPQTAAGADANVEFDPTAAASRLHMEAATHALAGAEAGKLAQQEARAVLEAKLRVESEGRARALAEARAQGEAEARAKAQAAALAAANARAQAEQDAATAPDAAARADAETRMRTASAAEVRAKAEADARVEAEARARALVDEKTAAEKRAREEAQKHTASEEHAQARAAAENRAHAALQAHSEAVANARAEGNASPSRVQLDEHEDAADRARDETKALAAAQRAPRAEPAADAPFGNLAQELTARVHSERRARDEAQRRSRADSDTGESGARTGTDSFPSLQFAPDSDDTPAPKRNGQSAPAAGAGADAALPTISLASGAGRGDVRHTTPDHVPSALERAMMARAAQTESRPEGDGGMASAPATPAGPPPAAGRPAAAVSSEAAGEPEPTLAAETGRAPYYPEAKPPESAPPPAAAAQNTAMPTLDDADPLHERLNVDRTAHDLIAEAAAKSREADVLALSRQAIDTRRQRQEAEARRAGLALQEKKRRKAARALVFAAFGIPAFAIAWLQFMPLNSYVPDAQKALSERLNQPTTISVLRYVLLPSPRVVLEGVRIGAAQGIHVDRVDAHAWPTAFISGPLVFDNVEATGVSIDPGMLGLIPTWTGGRSAGAVHSSHLKLSDVKLSGPDAQLEGMSGEVSFARNGTVIQAVLNNENLKLEIVPQLNGVRVALNARDWRAPFGPAFPFSHLTLEGIADKQQFATTNLSARIGGGDLTGTLAARWEGPMIVGGEFKLHGARLDDLTPLVSPNFRAKGLLGAAGRYAMQADSASGLMEKALLEGTFAVTRGELTGIDLVRAVQTGGSSLNGGRTTFDELKGSVRLSGGQYSYRNLQLSSGPLDAAGYVDVAPGGQLSGRVNARLNSRSGVVAQGAYTVSGTVKDPKLVR